MGDQTVALHCHPASAMPGVKSIAVALSHDPKTGLSLHYRLTGKLEALNIPLLPACASCPRKPVDGLWQHTCFELFVAAADTPDYREFNFAPSGDWASYAFSDYRERDPTVPSIGAPQISLNWSGDSLELNVVLAPALLPNVTKGTLKLGLSAVIKATDGSTSFWALRHPGGTPDFHLRDSFTLSLPMLDQSAR